MQEKEKKEKERRKRKKEERKKKEKRKEKDAHHFFKVNVSGANCLKFPCSLLSSNNHHLDEIIFQLFFWA